MKTRILLLLMAVLAVLPAAAYEPADNAGLSKKEQRRTLRGYKWSVEASAVLRIGDECEKTWDGGDIQIPVVYYNSSAFYLSTTHGYQFNNYFFLGGGVALGCYTDRHEFMMPVYAAFRVNILNKKVSPYVDGRAGLSFGNSVGAYSSIALGLRIAMERKTGLLIAAEYDVGEYDILLFSKGLGLRIGYEF